MLANSAPVNLFAGICTVAMLCTAVEVFCPGAGAALGALALLGFSARNGTCVTATTLSLAGTCLAVNKACMGGHTGCSLVLLIGAGAEFLTLAVSA